MQKSVLPRLSSNLPQKQLVTDGDGVPPVFGGVDGQRAEGSGSHVGYLKTGLSKMGRFVFWLYNSLRKVCSQDDLVKV